MAVENGKILNLEEHQIRIESTFKKYYPEYQAHQLQSINLSKLDTSNERQKLKLLYNHSTFQFLLSQIEKISFSKFYLIHLSYFQYNYKYSDRLIFKNLKQQLVSDEEIIMVINNEITDTSFSNLCFYDGSGWFTPSKTLLNGTMRSHLIKEKIIATNKIQVDDLVKFSKFKMINALNNFNTAHEYSTSIIITSNTSYD